jgi:hypothetical protein
VKNGVKVGLIGSKIEDVMQTTIAPVEAKQELQEETKAPADPLSEQTVFILFIDFIHLILCYFFVHFLCYLSIKNRNIKKSLHKEFQKDQLQED